MTLDIAAKVPLQTIRPDPVTVYAREQMKLALDVLTDELLADYIANHLQSRGAPVGSA
jgi:hypothetical protein